MAIMTGADTDSGRPRVRTGGTPATSTGRFLRSRPRWVALRRRTVTVTLPVLLAGCGMGQQDLTPGTVTLSVPAGMARGAGSEVARGTSWPEPREVSGPASATRTFRRVTRIRGEISPKSVVASPDGFVTAQNMMYRHTVTVYDRDHELVRTISDRVVPSRFGYRRWNTPVRGAPVEASFSPDGDHLWVSNYSMFGAGFGPEGTDDCTPASGFDRSFLYRISTATWQVTDIALVGSVPKYVQASPDGRYVLVSNWCSWDLSIVDTRLMRQVARVPLGRYPRGIAISPDGSRAYVAVMGSTRVAVVDVRRALSTETRGRALSWIENVGSGPRHLNISPDGRYLYVTLNADGRVAKIDTRRRRVVARVSTGQQPRSAVLSPDGTALFVVNYASSTVSRVRTRDMTEVETVAVDHHPIGITYSPLSQEIWVASYVGSITVFADEAA
jgi:YVTN family beta-propeller protein